MKLNEYLESLTPAEREAFAERTGTTDGYLKQLKCGHRKPSVPLCRRFVEASSDSLTLAELRPDVWGEQAA